MEVSKRRLWSASRRPSFTNNNFEGQWSFVGNNFISIRIIVTLLIIRIFWAIKTKSKNLLLFLIGFIGLATNGSQFGLRSSIGKIKVARGLRPLLERAFFSNDSKKAWRYSYDIKYMLRKRGSGYTKSYEIKAEVPLWSWAKISQSIFFIKLFYKRRNTLFSA